MGLTDDVMANDAALTFADTDGFAESLTYTKPRTTATRTILGVVERNPPQMMPGVGTPAPYLWLTVPNSTSNGMTPSEVILNVDTVLVAWNLGETAKALTVRQIVTQDAGMVTYELR